MRFVLDCSVTMSWCFADESDYYSDVVLDQLSKTEALVPSIWPLEVVNVLLVAERRKRINKAQAMRLVELLQSLPVAIDVSTAERATGSIHLLAREHKLSSYDAAYLELAMREGLPLATRDDQLARVAKRCGVEILERGARA
ncbi:MAG: type II toxin-antitoxin system VapC family toxin [Deltaproteobacteria bacterium]|nr:type II toxin-antitoxin system VapC family toxin [Deltaproteobacteria bacterium]MBW2072398.1 type II toxin-antitoxin system VapC family toxin [Deltaproteobacteria bacterium]